MIYFTQLVQYGISNLYEYVGVVIFVNVYAQKFLTYCKNVHINAINKLFFEEISYIIEKI